jgi:hypothetical protein
MGVMTGTAPPYFMVALLAVIVSKAAGRPVPLSVTVSVGFAGSLVVKVRLADSAAAVVGVNVTLSVQFAPAATVPAQGLAVTAKSARFAPVIAVVYVSCALPVFDSVSVWGVLGVLCNTFPKANVAGDTPATGPKDAEDAVLDHPEVMLVPVGVQKLASGLMACTL